MSGEPLANGRLEIYTLNVEQADAHAVITEDGAINLIDADKTAVGEELDTILDGRIASETETGNIPIETFLVTHFHKDHSRGVGTLHDHGYEIQHVIEPAENRYELADLDTGKPEEGVSQTVLETYERGLEKHDPESVRQVSEGESLSTDLDTQVVAPPSEPGTLRFTSPVTGRENTLKPTGANANSLAFKTEGDQSVLFMGDIEDTAGLNGETRLMHQHDSEESDVDLTADILVLAHHGSDNATSTEFLDRVDPEVAVISSDLGQQHNHPTDEVLKNLYEHDVAVYWTAGHGTTRTDLDQTLSPAPMTDLETTNAADIAALKHYCRETDVAPEDVETLAPGNLPEETPNWITTAAPLVAQTREAIADAAITNADTVEEVRQTLASTPNAHDYLRAGVQADRDEHVTTTEDVNRTRESFFNAKRAERAYRQLPLHTRIRANLPTRFGGIDHPLQDIPDSDDIEGPRDVGELPKAVRTPSAGELRDQNRIFIAEHFRTAEDAADRAVATATTNADVTRRLRETPGAHKDFLYAIESPHAHTADDRKQAVSEELTPTNERTRSAEREQNQDRDRSLGL
jgi:competence protein ComEC